MAKETTQKKDIKASGTEKKQTKAAVNSKTPVNASVATKSATSPKTDSKKIVAANRDDSKEVKEKKLAPVKKAKGAKTVKVKKEKKTKKPKGRVKILPLIIVVVVIVAGYVFERFFLDSVLKGVIISGVQSSYGAKCDIDNVDLELMDGSFIVEGFALADVSKPMQNLFEFSYASIDFDVTQVFLGRFVADEIALEGFVLGTDRETSGELPHIIKEPEPAEDTKEGKFALAISDTKTNLNLNAKNIIQQASETYNPENMLSSYLENLQIPGMVDSAEKTIGDITTYWQDAAPGLEKSGDELFMSIQDVQSLLNTDNVDIKAITEGVETIQTLIAQGEKLQTQVSDVSSRLEGDIDTVSNLSTEIQSAVKADTSFVQSEIEKITSFTFDDAQGLVSSSFENFIIGVLGDYYPTVQKALDVLSEAKTNSDIAKQESEKKALERLQGRTIPFNAEMPTLLIRNITFSGSDKDEWISVSGLAKDISNNPDLLQKPATANLNLAMADFSGTLNALVDLRTETEHAPVELDFIGDGFDTSSLTTSSTLGVPSIGGDAKIKAGADFELTGDFDLSANFDFSPAHLTVAPFDPSSVYDIYSNILSSIQSFYVQSDIAFSLENGIRIGLDTDVDRQIRDGLQIALNAEIAALKDNLKVEAEAYLAGYTDQITSRIADFGITSDSMLNLQKRLGNVDGELDRIKQELEQRIKDQAAGAIQSGLQDVLNSNTQESDIGGRLRGLF